MKPATNDNIRKWLKPKRAKRVLARIEAAVEVTELYRETLRKAEDRIDRAAEILNGPDPAPLAEPPTEHPDEYLPPGMDVGVLSFPITDRPKFIAVVIDDHMNVSWRPDLDWPSIFETLNDEPEWYFGNSGLILHAQYGWRVVSTEWMRKSREEGGTSYPFAEQIAKVAKDAKLTPGTPVGVFVASLWRAGWRSEVDRRTWVQWFDQKTWERIERPDFTEPATTEPYVYTMTDQEYKSVNSASYRNGVAVLANVNRVKRRWKLTHDTFDPGRIWMEGDTLRGEHHGNSGWASTDGGGYAYLWLTAWNGDGRIVSRLIRGKDDTTFAIEDFRTVMELEFGRSFDGDELFGIFLLNMAGDISTDIHPWRFNE